MAQKTIEFRNFQNAKVPLEVVARFFTSETFKDTAVATVACHAQEV